MAQIKKVILKDTITGDQLFPATSIDLLYNTDGTKWTPPTIPSPLNADQLQGHEASYFGTATQYTELSSKYDQLFQSVSNGKSLIASAITGKGVSTASDATFQQMAINIGNIASGNCIAGTNSSIEVQYSSPSIGHTLATVTITDAGLVSIRPTAIFCTCLGSGDCIYKNGTTYSFRWEHRGLTMGDSVNVSIGTGIIIMTCEYQTAFSPPFGSLNLWFAYKI